MMWCNPRAQRGHVRPSGERVTEAEMSTLRACSPQTISLVHGEVDIQRQLNPPKIWNNQASVFNMSVNSHKLTGIDIPVKNFRACHWVILACLLVFIGLYPSQAFLIFFSTSNLRILCQLKNGKDQ